MTSNDKYRQAVDRIEHLQKQFAAETDPLRRASLAYLIGLYYKSIGDPGSTLHYFRLALQEDPNHPQNESMRQEIELYQRTNRQTPWDIDLAVSPYDDAQDIEAHKHLPYEEFMNTIHRGKIRKSIVDTLLQIHQPGMQVLEAGCAAGGYYGILRLFAAVQSYCGVDCTPRMIETARKWYPEADFALMDVRQLGFPNDTFDIVFSTDVTMHLADWPLALAELYRITRQFLLLRMRVLFGDSYPTLVARLGTEQFEIPYVIHNQKELEASLCLLQPPFESIRIVRDQPETMYSHLWQILREHPDIPVWNRQEQKSINRAVDLLIIKIK